MKKLNITKEQYDFVLKNFVFNEQKKEKTIFELWFNGYNNIYIANFINKTEGTVRNRKIELLKNINFLLNEHEIYNDLYCVYIHTFPNKKVYIGMTKNTDKRWNNGLGYKDNKEMFEDIILFGWNNIEHEIIQDNLTYENAFELEQNKIKQYKSNKSEFGYNKNVIK